MYTNKVLKHFKSPHNYGKMKNPDAIGKAGNIICGDVLWLYIKVTPSSRKKSSRATKKSERPYGYPLASSRVPAPGLDEIIKEIKFETLGCVAAIATSSLITDLVKGKTLKQAMEIDKDKIIKSLGGLPPIKIHCSILAIDALSEAIYNYLLKKKRPIPKKLLKRHHRIEKEKKLIEGKYKEWEM